MLARIVSDCRHPERLIELFYWSDEPQLAEVMRQYVTLPSEVRTALHAFLALVKDKPESVSVRIGPEGEMILSSPAARNFGKLAELTPSPPVH